MYSELSLANDVYERLKVISPQAPPSLIPRLVTLIPAALTRLAETVAQSARRELLRTTFTATAANGVAPLASLIALAEPLIVSDLSRAELYSTGTTYPLEYVPDRLTLQIESAIEFGFYAVEGLNLYVREANGDYATYSDVVTIIATRIPLLSTLPVELEDELLSHLIGLVAPQAQAA